MPDAVLWHTTVIVLCFTDTNSFVCHLQSKDLVCELSTVADHSLDTSNFEHAHALYSNVDFCWLGKFKPETADVPLMEFCGLPSKMYSLAMLTGDRNYCNAKGPPKAYVRKHVTLEQYLHVLHHLSGTTYRFHVSLAKPPSHH